MKRFLLIAAFLAFTDIPIMARADLVNYNVTAVFYEPALQGPPIQNTTFMGSFTWDTSLKQITNLKGKMNSSMFSNELTLDLVYQVYPSASDGSGGIKATVFKNNTSAIFKNVDYTNTNPAVMTDGSANAYFTLDVNPSNPANTSSNDAANSWCINGTHPSSDICKIMYADCTTEGLMGSVCMTGHASVGSMGATPLSLTITPANTVSPYLLIDSGDDDDD